MRSRVHLSTHMIPITRCGRGDNDADMMLGRQTLCGKHSGLAFVADGQVVAELAFPEAGLRSTESEQALRRKCRR